MTAAEREDLWTLQQLASMPLPPGPDWLGVFMMISCLAAVGVIVALDVGLIGWRLG